LATAEPYSNASSTGRPSAIAWSIANVFNFALSWSKDGSGNLRLSPGGVFESIAAEAIKALN
jgi:hypothetical protein